MQKVWLVTGSSSGLGQSFVKAICEQGDFVVATARQTSALADLVARYPEQVLPMALDVTDGTQIETVVEATIQLKGHIDGTLATATVQRLRKARRMRSIPCSRRISSAQWR